MSPIKFGLSQLDVHNGAFHTFFWHHKSSKSHFCDYDRNYVQSAAA